jgi:hypothetical protein
LRAQNRVDRRGVFRKNKIAAVSVDKKVFCAARVVRDFLLDSFFLGRVPRQANRLRDWAFLFASSAADAFFGVVSYAVGGFVPKQRAGGANPDSAASGRHVANFMIDKNLHFFTLIK